MKHENSSLDKLATVARYAATLGLAKTLQHGGSMRACWSVNPVIDIHAVLTVQAGPHYCGHSFHVYDEHEQYGVFVAKHWLSVCAPKYIDNDPVLNGYILGCVYGRDLHSLADVPAGYLDNDVGAQLRECDFRAHMTGLTFEEPPSAHEER